jgi:hypothetical protein
LSELDGPMFEFEVEIGFEFIKDGLIDFG